MKFQNRNRCPETMWVTSSEDLSSSSAASPSARRHRRRRHHKYNFWRTLSKSRSPLARRIAFRIRFWYSGANDNVLIFRQAARIPGESTTVHDAQCNGSYIQDRTSSGRAFPRPRRRKLWPSRPKQPSPFRGLGSLWSAKTQKIIIFLVHSIQRKGRVLHCLMLTWKEISTIGMMQSFRNLFITIVSKEKVDNFLFVGSSQHSVKWQRIAHFYSTYEKHSFISRRFTNLEAVKSLLQT